MTPPRRPARTRKETVRANDEAIQWAALSAITEQGFDSLTFNGVARRAGLTVGAVYGRVENKSELGNLVWRHSLHDWFSASLDRVLDAALSGDPRSLAAAVEAWEDEPILSGSAVELLIASLFDDELAEVVGADARALINARTRPDSARLRDRQTAAASVLVLSFSLGRLLARRSSPDLAPLEPGQVQILANMHSAPVVRTRLRKAPVGFRRDDVAVDPARQVILEAVVDVMGRVGYRRATIARMGRAAGMSGGALFGKFEDKAQLVAEAADELLLSPYEMWTHYSAVEAEFGPMVSRAMWVADVLEPANSRRWALNLELARVSVHTGVAPLPTFPDPSPPRESRGDVRRVVQ